MECKSRPIGFAVSNWFFRPIRTKYVFFSSEVLKFLRGHSQACMTERKKNVLKILNSRFGVEFLKSSLSSYKGGTVARFVLMKQWSSHWHPNLLKSKNKIKTVWSPRIDYASHMITKQDFANLQFVKFWRRLQSQLALRICPALFQFTIYSRFDLPASLRINIVAVGFGCSIGGEGAAPLLTRELSFFRISDQQLATRLQITMIQRPKNHTLMTEQEVEIETHTHAPLGFVSFCHVGSAALSQEIFRTNRPGEGITRGRLPTGPCKRESGWERARHDMATLVRVPIALVVRHYTQIHTHSHKKKRRRRRLRR